MIRVPPKLQVAIYCLSMSHNFSDGWTDAVIVGQHLTEFPPDIVDVEASTISARLRTLIQSLPQLWAHPLLLPTVLLKNYMNRSEIFAANLDDQIVNLEASVGVTFAGRLEGRRAAAVERTTGKLPTRKDMVELIMDTHTALTHVIFMSRMATFTHDCAEYLLSLGQGINNRILAEETKSLCELQEGTRYMESASHVMQGFCTSLKDRVSSQIQQLYSIVAQTDNRLSARIAVTSGRDSTAMKTLAFITAVFLPGTYIATLFSITMFDWYPSNGTNSSPSSAETSSHQGEISPKFWIYWAITVPLTIAVIAIWRVWWVYQDQAYHEQLAGEIDGLVAKNHGMSGRKTLDFLRQKLRMPSESASPHDNQNDIQMTSVGSVDDIQDQWRDYP